MPSKYNIFNNVYSKPIVINKLSDDPVFINNVATKYAFVDNNKDWKSISDQLKDHENVVIYNKANDKLFSLIDGKKKCIAINKSGEPLTGDNFGKKMKPLSIDGNTDDLTKTKDNSNGPTTMFNNLWLGKINGVDFTNLVKRVESLESIFSSLTDSDYSSNDANEDTDNDPITGLKTRVSSLEAAVKLDQKYPSSSESNNTIDYYLNRDREDILSLFDQINSYGTSIPIIQRTISTDIDWSGDNSIDLLEKINVLTARVEALEG